MYLINSMKSYSIENIRIQDILLISICILLFLNRAVPIDYSSIWRVTVLCLIYTCIRIMPKTTVLLPIIHSLYLGNYRSNHFNTSKSELFREQSSWFRNHRNVWKSRTIRRIISSMLDSIYFFHLWKHTKQASYINIIILHDSLFYFIWFTIIWFTRRVDSCIGRKHDIPMAMVKKKTYNQSQTNSFEIRFSAYHHRFYHINLLYKKRFGRWPIANMV